VKDDGLDDVSTHSNSTTDTRHSHNFTPMEERKAGTIVVCGNLYYQADTQGIPRLFPGQENNMEVRNPEVTQVFEPGKPCQARVDGEWYTFVDPSQQQDDLLPVPRFTKASAPCCGGRCCGDGSAAQLMIEVTKNPKADAGDQGPKEWKNVRDFLKLGAVRVGV